MKKRYPLQYTITTGFFLPNGGLQFVVRNSTEELLAEAFEELLRAGCQFGMCDGPRLRPVHMLTCSACQTIAKLAHKFAVYSQLNTQWRQEARKRGRLTQHG